MREDISFDKMSSLNSTLDWINAKANWVQFKASIRPFVDEWIEILPIIIMNQFIHPVSWITIGVRRLELPESTRSSVKLTCFVKIFSASVIFFVAKLIPQAVNWIYILYFKGWGGEILIKSASPQIEKRMNYFQNESFENDYLLDKP